MLARSWGSAWAIALGNPWGNRAQTLEESGRIPQSLLGSLFGEIAQSPEGIWAMSQSPGLSILCTILVRSRRQSPWGIMGRLPGRVLGQVVGRLYKIFLIYWSIPGGRSCATALGNAWGFRAKSSRILAKYEGHLSANASGNGARPWSIWANS